MRTQSMIYGCNLGSSSGQQFATGHNRPMSATATLSSYHNLPDMHVDQMIVNGRSHFSSGGAQGPSGGRSMSALLTQSSTTSHHSQHQSNYQSNGVVIHPEFNAEISELKANNQQAHEKLRQLQFEQQQLASIKNGELVSASSNVINSAAAGSGGVDESCAKKKELLEKLKQEQSLLKEQINVLNKQRETAQHELEILGVKSGGGLVNTVNKNGLYDMNSVTPNLSPISNENLFHHVKQ
jgi:hypothetical protein